MSEDDKGKSEEKKKPKKYRQQKYRVEWELDPLFKSWLSRYVDGNAYCDVCRTLIQPRRASLLQHLRSTKHKEATKDLNPYIEEEEDYDDPRSPDGKQRENGQADDASAGSRSPPSSPATPRKKRKSNADDRDRDRDRSSRSYKSRSSNMVVAIPSQPKYATIDRYHVDRSMELVMACTKAMEKIAAMPAQNEYDAVGVNVGSKLSRMDPTQAIFAEAIIIKVLARGLLGSLSEATNLVDVVNTNEKQYINL